MRQIDAVGRAGYTQNQQKSAGMEGRVMSRLMLFALVLFQGCVVFCQSTATPPGGPQIPGKVSMGQWAFGLSSGQPGKTAARPTFKIFDCNGPNTTQIQVNVPIDFGHLFDVPCTDLKSRDELVARNESSYSWSPLIVGPHLKGEPIPTQWPNAKVEQIPTQWPNLKLQMIDGGTPGLAPAPGSRK
jgi:hypothetical protein